MESLRKIAVFVCDWAVNPKNIDYLASSSISPIKIVKVKCIGRIDPALYFETFINGTDGIFVAGCERGNCHFLDGNLHAEKKIGAIKRALSFAGFQPERLQLLLISPLEWGSFEKSLNLFSENCKSMGQSPLYNVSDSSGLRERMLAMKAALENFRSRAIVSKELELTEKLNVYGERKEPIEFEELEGEILEEELVRNMIFLSLREGALSVKDLSKKLGLDSKKVLGHIVALRQRGWVEVKEIQGNTPLYRALEVLP